MAPGLLAEEAPTTDAGQAELIGSPGRGFDFHSGSFVACMGAPQEAAEIEGRD
jgi:hypothetical protein